MLAMMALGGASGAAALESSVELVLLEALTPDGDVRELALPDHGRRALIWPLGVLTVPDSLDWSDDGRGGLRLTLDGDGLVGIGPQGRFDLAPGSYDLDTPLLLDDGSATLLLTGGRLEVMAGRLVYSRPPARRDPRGDFAIVAGLLVAITVLLRGVRRRQRDGAPGGGRRGRGA